MSYYFYSVKAATADVRLMIVVSMGVMVIVTVVVICGVYGGKIAIAFQGNNHNTDYGGVVELIVSNSE
jgi:hypothetical protein